MLNRSIVLNAFIKHETLSIDDIAKPENLGIVPDKQQLQLLLDQLTESKHLTMLASVTPRTYTITDTGIAEADRLKELESGTSESIHAL